MMEYRDVFLLLLKKFDESKQSRLGTFLMQICFNRRAGTTALAKSQIASLILLCRGFLKDLIETTHLFLKMLEVFCKTNTHLVGQKKKRKTKKKKPRQQAARQAQCMDIYEARCFIDSSYVDLQ